MQTACSWFIMSQTGLKLEVVMGRNKNEILFSESYFRFEVVSQVKARLMAGVPLAKAVQEVKNQEWFDRYGKLRKVSCRSIYRWVNLFDEGGIKGLESSSKPKTTSSLVLSEKFLEFLKQEKGKDAIASIPEVIRRARAKDVLKVSEKVSRTSTYRACVRMNLPVKRIKKKHHDEMRRFAYEHRMQMVLCDGKHFRAGFSHQKRVALVFIDDATRMGLHGVVGTSESTALFLRGLFEMIQKYGLMVTLYLDRGPGFASNDTFDVVKSIGTFLVHGRAKYPEGHGKVEKFNQTLLAELLRGFRGNPTIDPLCMALELRLQHYISKVYNHKNHEGLQGKTPFERFTNDERPLNFPENSLELKRHFVVKESRSVSKDNVISIDGSHYEMPSGYALQKVTVYRKLLESKVCVYHKQAMIELHKVDLLANAITRRPPSKERAPEPVMPTFKTNADIQFEKDMGPLVGPDGNFTFNKGDKSGHD
jgi:putative transposase